MPRTVDVVIRVQGGEGRWVRTHRYFGAGRIGWDERVRIVSEDVASVLPRLGERVHSIGFERS